MDAISTGTGSGGAGAAGGRIPVTVVTGFLGAGKTTLIRRLLERADGKRIALVVNEFGDMGFDGGLLSGCLDPACAEDDVIELTNGCLCCTVADDFLPAMERLLDRNAPPDHIVIETSGLALPQPLIAAFAWPAVRTRTTVDGVVAVVDTRATADGLFAPDPAAVARQRAADESLDHDSPLEELFHDQLSAADMVVLTKCDLASTAEVERVETIVRAEARAGVAVVHTAGEGLPPAVLLGIGAAAEEDLATRRGHHDEEEPHEHDDFASCVLAPAPFDTAEDARAAVERILTVAGILRVKGSVAVAGKAAPLMVQAVGPRLETWYGRPGTAATGLVVIGLAPVEPACVERLVLAAGTLA